MTDSRPPCRQTVENVQRDDLSHLDLARVFDRLTNKKEGGRLSAKQLAEAIGKSEAFVSEHRSLMRLTAEDQQRLEVGELTFEEAREIARARRRIDRHAEEGTVETSGTIHADESIPTPPHCEQQVVPRDLPSKLENGENVYKRFAGQLDPHSGTRVLITGTKPENEVEISYAIKAVRDHLAFLRSLNKRA